MDRCLKGTCTSHTHGLFTFQQEITRHNSYRTIAPMASILFEFPISCHPARFSSVRLTFRDCVELTVFQSFALIGVRESSKKKRERERERESKKRDRSVKKKKKKKFRRKSVVPTFLCQYQYRHEFYERYVLQYTKHFEIRATLFDSSLFSYSFVA